VSFRTQFLGPLAELRKIAAEPPGFDLRTSILTIRTRTWTGGDNGAEVRLGTSTDSDLVLVPRPKLTPIDGGGFLVGPITPQSATGGYTVAQLNPLPTLTAGQEVLYILSGPAGDYYYTLVEIQHHKAFRYMLKLAPLDRAVPH
jgi:hypothetical protein